MSAHTPLARSILDLALPDRHNPPKAFRTGERVHPVVDSETERQPGYRVTRSSHAMIGVKRIEVRYPTWLDYSDQMLRRMGVENDTIHRRLDTNRGSLFTLSSLPSTATWGSGPLNRMICYGGGLLQITVVGVLHKIRLEAACPMEDAASFVYLHLLRGVDRDALAVIDRYSDPRRHSGGHFKAYHRAGVADAVEIFSEVYDEHSTQADTGPVVVAVGDIVELRCHIMRSTMGRKFGKAEVRFQSITRLHKYPHSLRKSEI